MTDQSNLQSTNNGALCNWCHKPLVTANMFRESVCIHCYKLLSRAGLKESEIFSFKTTDKVEQAKAVYNAGDGSNNK